MGESDLIFEELAQLSGQYKVEVPGARKAWPRSIKERVLRLSALGAPMTEIARRSKIPYYTVYNWAKPQKRAKSQGRFRELAIVEKRGISVRPEIPELPLSTSNNFATVTVTMPNGCKVEGVPVKAALAWAERAMEKAR